MQGFLVFYRSNGRGSVAVHQLTPLVSVDVHDEQDDGHTGHDHGEATQEDDPDNGEERQRQARDGYRDDPEPEGSSHGEYGVVYPQTAVRQDVCRRGGKHTGGVGCQCLEDAGCQSERHQEDDQAQPDLEGPAGYDPHVHLRGGGGQSVEYEERRVEHSAFRLRGCTNWCTGGCLNLTVVYYSINTIKYQYPLPFLVYPLTKIPLKKRGIFFNYYKAE